MSINGEVSTALTNIPSILNIRVEFKTLQRLVILNYKNANGEELVGIALELVEETNGGIQVRVLRDSEVVSCVSVVPLEECRVSELQGCDCCE